MIHQAHSRYISTAKILAAVTIIMLVAIVLIVLEPSATVWNAVGNPKIFSVHGMRPIITFKPFAAYQNHVLFKEWRAARLESSQCDNDSTLVMYDQIAILTNVTLNKAHLAGGDAGLTREDARPRADDQFNVGKYKVKFDAWRTGCDLPDYKTNTDQGSTLAHWGNTFVRQHMADSAVDNVITETTILIIRQEYANVYWTLMDVYDVVLTCAFLQIDPVSVSVLLFDGHPYGVLDPVWDMFKHVYRVRDLNTLTKFRHLVFCLNREYGPLLTRQITTPIPAINEFRTLLHSVHKEQISNFDRSRCEKKNFRILFVWRHDYPSRPNRNTTVSRKIANEYDLLNTARDFYSEAKITGLQLDQLSISDQLRWIAKTDILCGMHGAALSYAIIQPPGAAMIEMMPYWNWHMGHMAKVNQVHHVRYQDERHALGDNNSRIIPPDVVPKLIDQAIKLMC